MEELDAIVAAAPQRVSQATTLEELEVIDAELLGKRSKLTEVQRSIGSLPPEDKPRVGQAVQQARAALNEIIGSRRDGGGECAARA
jgi:phenylalanyl-tRNA synthetase alpha chain